MQLESRAFIYPYEEIVITSYLLSLSVPVDGGWGSWESWRPCNVQIKKQTRIRNCDNPVLKNGGACYGCSHEDRECSTGSVNYLILLSQSNST